MKYILIIALLGWANVVAGIDTSACAACHGTDGNSKVGNWPKIAGLPHAYLVDQLKEFRRGQDGNRFDASMFDITKNLSDADIEEYANFYSKQPMSKGVADKNLLPIGQKIYRSGNVETKVAACIACHGAAGKGNALAKFPPLAGQNSGYIVTQLKKYKAGDRKTDYNEIMRDISHRLSEAEMEAVSSYVAGMY